jgi:hypothetical protein
MNMALWQHACKYIRKKREDKKRGERELIKGDRIMEGIRLE